MSEAGARVPAPSLRSCGVLLLLVITLALGWRALLEWKAGDEGPKGPAVLRHSMLSEVAALGMSEGRLLIVGRSGQLYRVGKDGLEPFGPERDESGLSASVGGGLVVLSRGAWKVEVLDGRTGKGFEPVPGQVGLSLPGVGEVLQCARFHATASSRGLVAVSGPQAGRVWVAEARSGKEVWRTGPERGLCTALAFGRGFLAVVGGDGAVWLHDSESGRVLQTLETGERYPSHGPSPLTALSASEDGSLVAIALTGPRVLVWESATGARVQTHRAGRHTVTALAFSEDGGLLAAGSRSGLVEVWDREGRAVVAFPLARGADKARGVSSLLIDQGELVWAIGDRVYRAEIPVLSEQGGEPERP